MDDRLRDEIAATMALLAAPSQVERPPVVRQRRVSCGSPHDPRPWVDEREGREGRWSTEADLSTGYVVGLDDQDRPVIARAAYGTGEWVLKELWRHGPGWSEALVPAGAHRILFDDDGRVTLVVSFVFGVLTVERWSWEGDRPVRGELATLGHPQNEPREVVAYEARFDETGQLALLLRAAAGRGPSPEPADRPAALAALEADLPLTAALRPDEVVYDARGLVPPEQTVVPPDPGAGDLLAGDAEPPPTEKAAVNRARHDRAALEALLVDRGLGAHAPRIAREAPVGIRLVRAPAAGSRLGGPPVLPPGAPWPREAHGRPLAFIAAIDLAELPAPNALPEAGWMLFFALLDQEGPENLDVAENVDGALARLFVLGPDQAPVPAEAPPETVPGGGAWPVAFVPELTLGDHDETADELGLDPAEHEAYSALATELRWDFVWDEQLGDHRSRSDRWILGAATGAQGHAVEPDTTLLLHLTSTEALEIPLFDGALQFRVPDDALAARDWGAVAAMVDH